MYAGIRSMVFRAADPNSFANSIRLISSSVITWSGSMSRFPTCAGLLSASQVNPWFTNSGPNNRGSTSSIVAPVLIPNRAAISAAVSAPRVFPILGPEFETEIFSEILADSGSSSFSRAASITQSCIESLASPATRRRSTSPFILKYRISGNRAVNAFKSSFGVVMIPSIPFRDTKVIPLWL